MTFKQWETSTPMPCKALRFLYRTLPGRILLRLLITPAVAKTGGFFMNSPLSKGMIKGFIKKNNIDTARYEDRTYRSYNDYFTRKHREGVTVFDTDPTHVNAPCDSRLSVYPINEDSIFKIKGSHYSVEELLEDASLAEHFRGGYAFIFRLSVDDYHRYHYIDSGVCEPSVKLRGVLHTVQPIATERYNIYKKNQREVTLQHTERLGDIAYVEVGALMIGKIKNHHRDKYTASRSEEKGYFEYGGSTVVILFEKDRIAPDTALLEATAQGLECRVRLEDTVAVTR